jgi:beta-galactosidase
VGIRGDKAVAESVLTTAGKVVALRVTADRSVVQADGQDLSFVTVEAIDAEGRFQPRGPGGSVLRQRTRRDRGGGERRRQDSDSYQGDRRKLFQGRALVVVRTTRQSGAIQLTAKTAGLAENVLRLDVKPAAPRSELR